MWYHNTCAGKHWQRIQTWCLHRFTGTCVALILLNHLVAFDDLADLLVDLQGALEDQALVKAITCLRVLPCRNGDERLLVDSKTTNLIFEPRFLHCRVTWRKLHGDIADEHILRPRLELLGNARDVHEEMASQESEAKRLIHIHYM